jgi:retron-type reverse transcriptase
VRIAQATKVGRWGKVRALQRLLTHSYSGKVLAVRRVTENDGKKIPGVDQEIWGTPEKKTQAVHAFQRRGYQPQPLRRVYILKSKVPFRWVEDVGVSFPGLQIISECDEISALGFCLPQR